MNGVPGGRRSYNITSMAMDGIKLAGQPFPDGMVTARAVIVRDAREILAPTTTTGTSIGHTYLIECKQILSAAMRENDLTIDSYEKEQNCLELFLELQKIRVFFLT